MLLWLWLSVLLTRHTSHAIISGASVTPASLNAGATGTVDVAFTTGTTVPIGGAVIVIFPPPFVVATTALTNIVGMDTANTIAVQSSTNTITIAVVNTAIAPGTISFTVNAISNPGAGVTAKFTVRTLDTQTNILESTSNVAGVTIVSTTLSTATLTFSTLNAGALVTCTLAFTTDVTLRAGATIELVFPTLPSSKFIVAGARVTNVVNVDPLSTQVMVAGMSIQLVLVGASIPAGTAVSVTFGNIYSPAAQTTGTFTARTRHSSTNIFQANLALPGVTTLGSAIANTATVTPTAYIAGMTATYTISFDTICYLPTGTIITVTFPARFNLATATMGSILNMMTGNAVFAFQSATTMVLTLGAGPTLPGSNRGFTLTNVVNPGTSCNQYIYEYCSTTWETYSVQITDAAGNLYQSGTMPGTPILKAPMSWGRVRPASALPLTVTSITMQFNTQMTVPLGGAVELVLPSSYAIPGVVTPSGLVGIPIASTVVTVTGLQIALTIAGAAVAPTTGLVVTFSSVTTPSILDTGFYTIRTRDALGNIIEEITTIIGEGCLYLKDCSGHGACTLLSQRCVCSPGWGAASDIADYKSPICDMRTCPAGRVWNAIPTSASDGHSQLKECSGMGVCDRSTGQCTCVEGFGGAACDRSKDSLLDDDRDHLTLSVLLYVLVLCPNKCSKRGRCVSMREMATIYGALPLSSVTTYTETSTALWDADRIFGCVCDSAWAVGFGSGELQATEYFGADCSRRHCPTGNDPDTDADETNCQGVVADGGFATGAAGNLCLVECSNRGLCSHKTGLCKCFAGYSGYACQIKTPLTK
ncbi:TPA: hypothetical protein N0F65_003027 [Lagenidium giganteum]|uniref:EGF-like domain-containing protein n=1 Tax=Lagenidium giganteum TaxID=4803 RepID=A0AAV2YV17_9STRA|nr:TPA: hypothetical protein N0F65_003027 [Lagenidium giganteum]